MTHGVFRHGDPGCNEHYVATPLGENVEHVGDMRRVFSGAENTACRLAEQLNNMAADYTAFLIETRREMQCEVASFEEAARAARTRYDAIVHLALEAYVIDLAHYVKGSGK